MKESPVTHPDFRFISQAHVQPILAPSIRLSGTVRVLSLLGESPQFRRMTTAERLARPLTGAIMEGDIVEHPAVAVGKARRVAGAKRGALTRRASVRTFEPRPCRSCDDDFTPSINIQRDCIQCRATVPKLLRAKSLSGPRFSAWEKVKGPKAKRAMKARQLRIASQRRTAGQ